MNADERIEKLLNGFGQTISDLPKSSRVEWAYSSEQRWKALNAATEWSAIPFISGNSTGDYICHLVDIIDRMEVALETAKLTMDCKLCKTPFKTCQLDCETHAKVTDWQLSGMYKEEFEEFMEGQKDA